MIATHVRVRPSTIHGYGTFIVLRAKKGQSFFSAGVPYPNLPHGGPAPIDDTYCLVDDRGQLLDLVDEARWINHSCDPNLSVSVDVEEGIATFTALRDIVPGEELSYDYSYERELPEAKLVCRCASPRCRGTMAEQ